MPKKDPVTIIPADALKNAQEVSGGLSGQWTLTHKDLLDRHFCVVEIEPAKTQFNANAFIFVGCFVDDKKRTAERVLIGSSVLCGQIEREEWNNADKTALPIIVHVIKEKGKRYYSFA